MPGKHLAVVLGLVCASAPVGSPHTPSEPARRIFGVMVEFKKRQWRPGDLASIQFSVTGELFNGEPEARLAAFLYQSPEPDPFLSAPFAPEFVGVVEAPSTQVVPLILVPERNPINEFTAERFVQGAVFDMTTGELEGLSNVAYLDVDYSADPESFLIDFQLEDDFATPLVNGQSVSTPPEFGNLLSISADEGDHFGPAIFDSDPAGPNAGGSDPDLLVDQGNLLILQGDGTQTIPGIFDIPDDYRFGGTLRFAFDALDLTRQVEMKSIDLVDMCIAPIGGARVTLTDVLGNQRIYDVPAGWTRDISTQGPPGFGTLDLTTLDPQPGFAATATAMEIGLYIPEECSLMEVELFGSGAVGALAFDREADPGGDPPGSAPEEDRRRRRKL